MAFIVAILFSLAINLLVLTSPIYMMQVFDRVVTSGSLDTLAWLTLLAALAYLTYGALETVRSNLLSRLGAWVDRALSERLIVAGLNAGLAGQPTGSQPLRDVAQLRAFLSGPAMAPLFDAPWAPVFLAVLWFMHPWLGAFATATAIVLLGVMAAGEALTRHHVSKGEGHQMQAYTAADATIRQGELVQAMGLLPALLGRWRTTHETALQAQQNATDRVLRLHGLTKAIRLFVQTAILGLGAWLVVKGELTSGGMIAGSILLGRALAPVDQLLGSWKQFISVREAWHRVIALLERFPAKAESMPLPAPKGALSVEGVTYLPPNGDKPVLRHVSFELEPGQSLGVIGPSAAGKSTLCRLLVGALSPNAGHVRLDHADINDWDRTQIGPHIGYLPQDVTLFAGTVAENIARMSKGDPALIVAAARQANIHEMILRLPQGYETRIDSTGVQLSGGQRQRIGLARALYGNPKLLVLDEPNSSLDAEGEAALLAALATARQKGCTTIIVSHRPSMLEHSDLLLFLRDGMAQAFGPIDDIWPRLTGQPFPARSAAARSA
ncbi:type I secretion system permease/ATPase [uncultured Ferrovibrio sp.]|uniref:type I secretion system permease/ATPase n=1 Tax=uncultured Ferrovibrio sp. TaxID=1576913 RepID=UPI002604B27A|nr:type I secretion system permease/ATPase [uncultured Ferrovibrio sp.]